MLNVSFLEKKQAKILKKEKYQRSFLQAYDYDLEQKNMINQKALVAHKKVKFEEKNAKVLKQAERKDKAFRNRVWEIDLVRALIIIGMLVDHFIYDLWDMFPSIVNRSDLLNIPWYYSMYSFSLNYWVHPVRLAFRIVGVALLAFLVGINTRFSRSPLKRGLIIFGCGMVVNLAFLILGLMNVTGFIIINAISCYGLCLLIYTGIHALFGRFKKAWKWICLGLGIAICIAWGFISNANKVMYIDSKYDNFFFVFFNDYHCIPSISNIKQIGFVDVLKILTGLTVYGDDWLPLFPFLGIVFLGAFVGQTVYKNKKSLLCLADKDGSKRINEKFNRATKPLLFFGHHTLLIYVLHQVVFVILFVAIATLFLGLPLAL